MIHESMMHLSMMHVSMMHVFMMHVSMMHVSMMQVSMMLISMILDHEACISDAVLFGDRRKDGRTNKAILGVGCMYA